MNTKTFKFGLVVIAAIGVLALPAMGQDAQATSFGTTNSIAANGTTTVNVGSGLEIDKQHDVGLLLKFQGNGTGTGNIVVSLARGVSGSYETTPPSTLKFTNALVNTTAVIGYHQIDRDLIASVHQLKIVSIQNYDGTIAGTNASVYLVKKLER